jgi:hypothetical protein
MFASSEIKTGLEVAAIGCSILGFSVATEKF